MTTTLFEQIDGSEFWNPESVAGLSRGCTAAYGLFAVGGGV